MTEIIMIAFSGNMKIGVTKMTLWNQWQKEIDIENVNLGKLEYRYPDDYVKWLERKLIEEQHRSSYLLCSLLGDPTSHIPKLYREKFDKQYSGI